MTPLTGATVDDPVQVITNNTSADPISLSALISFSLCVPEPVRKTHISLLCASGEPMQSSGQGHAWNSVSLSAFQVQHMQRLSSGLWLTCASKCKSTRVRRLQECGAK